jgi:hypothetical protein
MTLLQKAEVNHEAQRTQRFPLNFFVIFVFFAVKKLFAVELSISSVLSVATSARSGKRRRWMRLFQVRE